MENGYVQKETVNHKEGRSVARVFVQGKYLKRGEQSSTPIGCNSAEGESQEHGGSKGESHGCGSIEGESRGRDRIEGESWGCGSIEGESWGCGSIEEESLGCDSIKGRVQGV